ncbi:hypothetical protein [Nonomuraea glycinis]|uniref:hypothetical protein n=1 Tax=Nonomuraea glycinis TaxID=2047744 RepID=UPI002E125BA2|nr:hypothetical protein OHA68_35070 [Nonomuraea glycinis]
MEWATDLLQKAEVHGRRSHAAMGHIGVEVNPEAPKECIIYSAPTTGCSDRCRIADATGEQPPDW